MLVIIELNPLESTRNKQRGIERIATNAKGLCTQRQKEKLRRKGLAAKPIVTARRKSVLSSLEILWERN